MAIGTAALLGSAGIGAAANLIGNIFGKKSSDNANATNLKIAQMNNEWSEKMMQKQMDYNTAQWQREAAFSKQQASDANAFTKEMWNASNEYNSAQNQAARLRAAGLNPALAMSGNNAGTAQGASGAQAATPSGNSIGLPSPSGATMQAFRPDFSGIGAAADSLASNLLQKDMQDANIRLLDKQTQWYDLKAQNEIAEAIERTNNWRLKNKYQEIANSWADSTFSSDVYNKIRQGWMFEEQAKNLVRNGLLLDKDIAWYDKRVNGDLSEQLSRISLNLANKELSLQQAESAFQDVWNKIEQRIGMKIDNDIKAHTRDVTIQRAKDAQNLYQLGQDAMRGVNRFGDDVQNWFEKNIIKPSKRLWKDTKRSFRF